MNTENNDSISLTLTLDVYNAAENYIKANEKNEIIEHLATLTSLLKSLSSDKLRAVRCECAKAAKAYNKALFACNSALGLVCSVCRDILTERGLKKHLPDGETENVDGLEYMVGGLLYLDEEYNHFNDRLQHLYDEYPEALSLI